MFENNEVRDSTEKAFIKATDTLTDNLNDFNLLEPYLISKKLVVKSDSIHRCIDEESMFEAIDESYYELKGDIDGVIEIPKRSQKRLDKYIKTE